MHNTRVVSFHANPFANSRLPPDYFWEELEPEAEEGFIALGWNASSWAGSIPYPATEYKEWGELSDEERQGAVELCYLNETWSMLPLSSWAVDYAALGLALEVGGGNSTSGEELVGEISVQASKLEIAVDDSENEDAEYSSARSLGIALFRSISIVASMMLLLAW